MMRTPFALILFCLAFSLAGCSSPPVARNPIEIDRSEYTRIFLAAEEVLRDHGFTLERRDHRFGTLSTPPQTSPTILEPWKDINTTFFQTMMSTANKTRRIARVTIEPIALATDAVPSVELPAGRLPETTVTVVPGDETPTTQPSASAMIDDAPTTFLLTVEVQVEQFQSSVRRLNGSTRGSSMISTLSANPGELQARAIPATLWRPMGRDPYLENRLVAAIVRRSVTIR